MIYFGLALMLGGAAVLLVLREELGLLPLRPGSRRAGRSTPRRGPRAPAPSRASTPPWTSAPARVAAPSRARRVVHPRAEARRTLQAARAAAARDAAVRLAAAGPGRPATPSDPDRPQAREAVARQTESVELPPRSPSRGTVYISAGL